MFEDELTVEDTPGTYYCKPTEVVVDIQTGMDLPRLRDWQTSRLKRTKVNPDDVFKILLPNTFQASQSK
jgi:hypothetical protein